MALPTPTYGGENREGRKEGKKKTEDRNKQLMKEGSEWGGNEYLRTGSM